MDWIRLHIGELFLLWSAHGRDELPAVLEVPHVGRTPEFRAELVATANGTLSERGLGTVEAPSPELVGLLHTVANSELTLDLRLDGDPAYRAVGCVSDRGAVAIGVSGTDVELSALREPLVAATLLQALPPCDQGRGLSVNLRVDDYTAACEAGERGGQPAFSDVLRDAGLREPEVIVMVRIATQRIGSGRLGATRKSWEGRWVRGEGTLTWVDTPDGRYGLRRDRGWLTITPLDAARLKTMAYELFTGARQFG
ncbi:ESX secretion-associated protein EspG [Amycolatopsis sp. WAC 01376]|uniref:ESX secretion-associated protein EspG n=1 Tax=Amycolatopsis sp. WAC 01376 TaxID=2203195 RepID=UPI000F77BC4B|nr:ESX secretion-associated protein EspG [Amycolatopsis sp. WAC 01376]RSM66086.1 ESX secretion-associated protein EspG [Amycolatopsis sp. WAC 01376]